MFFYNILMEQRTIIIGAVSALALVGIIILIIYLVKRDDDNGSSGHTPVTDLCPKGNIKSVDQQLFR